jgi:hypothetical protein
MFKISRFIEFDKYSRLIYDKLNGQLVGIGQLHASNTKFYGIYQQVRLFHNTLEDQLPYFA